MWEEQVFRGTAIERIIRLTDLTGASSGDLQYALSRTRLTGDRRWTLEDHIDIRLRLWRQTAQLRTGRHQPGSIVRLKGGSRTEVGYLCHYGRPSRAILDKGMAGRADFEVVVPRVTPPDFLPSRLWLPYGFWTLTDGSRVVFARDYLPMWHLVTSKKPQRLPPWLWIEQIKSTHHFAAGRAWEWYYPDVRQKVTQWLDDNNISGLPLLADTLPLLMQRGVTRVQTAVKFMATRSSDSDPIGPWHRYAEYNKADLDEE